MSSATYKEAVAPPTPPAGYVVFYAKSDSLLYYKDDTGAELPIKPVGAGTGDLLSDGTVPLVANWDLGAFILTALSFVSDVVTGTAPFIVASTTVVANLNASLLEGNAASSFASAAQGTKADAALPKAGGQMTGNITMAAAETVDGRDLSADGTKLDGVEDNATADQTGAEIKTAYELEADTNAYNDAAVTKLGGIEAAADVTDAANVAAANAVMDSDFSAAEGLMRKTGAGAYEVIKTNLNAAVAPGATDDSAAGYAVGSIWIDTTADKGYICLDATAAAAVWTETTQSGSGAVVTTKGDIFGFDTANKRVPVGTNGQRLEADSTQALGVKWVDRPAEYVGQNLQTGITYELVLSDAGKMVDLSNAAAITLTIPANSAVAFQIDTRIDLNQSGAGLVTVVITTDTLRGDAVSVGQWKGLSLWKRAATEWVIFGGTV